LWTFFEGKLFIEFKDDEEEEEEEDDGKEV
jgi:hypothetical protein